MNNNGSTFSGEMTLNKVSQQNSMSSSSLLAGGSFTGLYEDVSNYGVITVNIGASQASASDGIELHVSHDGITATFIKTLSICDGKTGTVHSLSVTTRYFKLVYNNNPTTASTVSIQVLYSNSKPGTLAATTSQSIDDNNDVTLTRAVNDHWLDLSRGVILDKVGIHKFGSTDIAASGTFQSVWGGTGLYPFPATAERIRIKAGGNAADDTAGTGARTIYIQGLDNEFVPITETIITAGASASAYTTLTFRRIIRAYVTTSGTNQINVGAIDIENELGVVISHIDIGLGQTQKSQYTVPKGHTTHLIRIQVTVDAKTNKTGSARLFRYDNLAIGRPKRLVWRSEGFTGSETSAFTSYISFGEKEDLDLEATSDTNGAGIHVNYDLVSVDQSW